MHEKIVAISSGANDMTIATVRPDGFAVMHVDVASLSGVHDGGDHLAVLVGGVDEHRRADRVEVSDVVRDILEMASVFAGVQQSV